MVTKLALALDTEYLHMTILLTDGEANQEARKDTFGTPRYDLMIILWFV